MVAGGFLVLALGGAGCSRSAVTPSTTPIVQENVFPAPKAGDRVVIEENGLERTVSVVSFVMGGTSAASWKLVNPKDQKELAAGAWTNATLNTAHPFYLPAIMGSPQRPLNEASVLWLAREEYRELTNTSGTTVDIRVLEDPAWEVQMKSSVSAKRGLDALKKLARSADDARIDLTYARKEATLVDGTLKVNGVDTACKIIRVRNWYGVYDILHDEDTPLVLSFTLDPQVEKTRLDVSKGDGLELAKRMNYRVTELKKPE